MNPDVNKLIAKAEECLAEARMLFENEFYLGAVNRAYYSLFDCLRALLTAKGVFAKTHQGVHAKFNELFVLTREFDPQYGQYQNYVFDLRQRADYDLNAEILREDAERSIDKAGVFLAAVHRYFKP
jgi:uncharacterized protein (UPF0332 family)